MRMRSEGFLHRILTSYSPVFVWGARSQLQFSTDKSLSTTCMMAEKNRRKKRKIAALMDDMIFNNTGQLENAFDTSEITGKEKVEVDCPGQ